MCQDFFSSMRINIRLQRQNICFCFFIILINRRHPLPQCFIELHLAENIKLVIYFQFQVMERMQSFHTLLNIFVVQWVAYSCAFQKFRDFITVFRIDIRNIIANMLSINSLINCRFLTTINKLVSPLSRNTHDIFLSFAGKQERPIRHALFQNRNICNFFCLCF